jgi:hypothetical protein
MSDLVHTRAPSACAVIVDSRNVRGQSRKVFGHGRQVSVGGIRRALTLYGFEVVEVYVGLATRTSAASPSTRLKANLEANRKYREQLERAGAVVLNGNLVERGGNLEEKQVDVLCALRVADVADRIREGTSRARCIVVLSEDMDLMPAYEFAERRGVKAYAAAYDTVHQRPDQREWILLSQEALRHICDPPGRRYGSALRDSLAAIVTSDAHVSAQWKVVAPRMDDGQALLSSNTGAQGLWRPARTLAKGERVSLYVTGVQMDPVAGRFPYLQLSDRQPTGSLAGVDVGEVLYWTGPTQVKVRFATSGEEAALRASPGTLLPGQEVAVVRTFTAGNQARHLVGAVTPWRPPASWPGRARTAMAEIKSLGKPSPGWVEATLTETLTPIVVHSSSLPHARVGTRLLVALCGQHGSGTPSTMPLACCLP